MILLKIRFKLYQHFSNDLQHFEKILQIILEESFKLPKMKGNYFILMYLISLNLRF